MTACVCSVEADHMVECWQSKIRKARKEHRCIECRAAILPGSRYERISGIDEGEPFSQATCLPCVRIWDDRFDSRVFGGFLEEYLQDCQQLSLTEVPGLDPDEADEIDDEDAAHVASEHRRMELLDNVRRLVRGQAEEVTHG